MQIGKIEAAPASAVPAEHEDAEILIGLETVRNARAGIYAFDNAEPGLPDEEASRLDGLSAEGEKAVAENWARTARGVAARLMLALCATNEERWVDSTLTQHGLLALYNRRGEMVRHDAQVVQAAYELMHLEWRIALDEYSRSAARFEDALRLKSFVETEEFRRRNSGASEDRFLGELTQRITEMEARADNEREIARLLRTPAPDLAAYKEKIEVAVAEGFEKQALAHLIRDANFLFATTPATEA